MHTYRIASALEAPYVIAGIALHVQVGSVQSGSWKVVLADYPTSQSHHEFVMSVQAHSQKT